ncbi:hypothetical protein HMPREF0322_01009 [Desulfitobacterium hafniense DP7]|uniref:Uncharacterized protein n=1 Tax=Desulfitobacterium hafniense DP7 TaxID=537010 RepID=G9XJ83_DESHA|nr:hypothetical protein HMPREF0322_01009 [Desulfitobacterium hafniense DP7]
MIFKKGGFSRWPRRAPPRIAPVADRILPISQKLPDTLQPHSTHCKDSLTFPAGLYTDTSCSFQVSHHLVYIPHLQPENHRAGAWFDNYTLLRRTQKELFELISC